MSDNHALAAMIASRICHDLISPLGAISNGVELLQLTAPGAPGPELQLIAQSVRSATARTRFLRLAFGIADEGQQIAQTEVRSMIADWSEGGRIAVDWQIRQDCSRGQARRGLLMLMCLEAALPQGGAIRVTAGPGVWFFRAEGRRVRLAPELWQMLTEARAESDLNPGRIQFALLRADLLAGAGLAAGQISEGVLDLQMPGPALLAP